MAYTRKRRSTRTRATRGGSAYQSRGRSRNRSGSYRKRASRPRASTQTIRIVVEQPSPAAAFPLPGATLPDSVGNVVALTAPKKARF